jgi:hypothetical protein
MTWLTKVKEALAGKKTYLVATVTILSAVIAWSTNTMDLWQMVQTVAGAVMACTIRSGISNG